MIASFGEERGPSTRNREAGVVEKFGVPPAAISDWLALVGDSADGFPGIRGFGAKTAAAVLARYGRIDDIPSDGKDWDVSVRGPKRLAGTLRARLDDALLFRRLATLVRDAPGKPLCPWG